MYFKDKYRFNLGDLIPKFVDLGSTPIHAACVDSSLEEVKYLLNFGADASVKDRYGKSYKDKCCQFCLGEGCLEKCAFVTGINMVTYQSIDKQKLYFEIGNLVI